MLRRYGGSVKTKILYLIGACVLVTCMFVVYESFSKGTLAVTSNEKQNPIVLTQFGDENKKRILKQSAGSLSAHLKPGKYTVSVGGQFNATSKTVFVVARKTTHYSLFLAKPVDFEPVSDASATSVVADSSGVTFIDTSTGYLSRISAQNTLTTLNTSVGLRAAKWANSTFGIGQDVDGKLYTIMNGAVQPLSVPFNYSGDGDNSVNFSVNSSHVYVAYGEDVYIVQDGAQRKIFTGTSSNERVYAGPDSVAIIAGSSGEGEVTSGLAVADTSGHKFYSTRDVALAAWSPDGKHLAALGQSQGYVFDEHLHETRSFSLNDGVNLVWLNNTSFAYSQGSQLWVYDTQSQAAHVIAAGSSDKSIDEVVVDTSNNYIYAVISSDNASSLYRVGLRGQKVQSFTYQLPDFLPDNTSPCSLHYVNFTAPTIIGYASGTSLDSCRTKSDSILSIYGISPKSFQYSLQELN